jgi:hypothetical protein
MSAQPETVGRFRIGAPLRAGEGGRLFTATDLDTDRRVVLRLFARDSDDWRRAFMARTAQLTALQHPHLARVLAGGTDATRAWWVYDHESVSTLAEALASETAPPLDRRLSMLAEVCRGAAYAWARGVTFLDLRPPWLWITSDGHCIVAGYRPPANEGRDLDTGMDQLDVLRYASPEEVLGTPQDARSVVFTVGVVLYEVVTGQRLFDGDRLVDLAQQILYGKVPSLVVPSQHHRPDRGAAAAAALKPVLARALARQPDDRFVSLADFADCLDTVARDVRDAVPTTVAASPMPVYDEHVQFTVYRPRTITPDVWETLLVFAHLDALPPDAPPQAPDPVEEVQRQARALLGDTSAHGRQTVDSDHAVPREGLLLVVPHADGVEFNPPTAAFQWLEAVHREEFRLRARPATMGQTVRGRVSIFLGAIILAEIPLTLRIGTTHAASGPPVRESTRPYRRIFASYSHRDQHVVEEFSRYAEAIGDQYLRDVVHLRAGEQWGDALKALIRQADVFQLFWSWHALQSPHVREEWQYALGLQRPSFVRPVYWDDPLPEAAGLPPEALRALHFERIRPVTVQTTGPQPTPQHTPARAPRETPPSDRTLAAPSTAGTDPPRQSPRGFTRLVRYIGPVAAVLCVVALLLPFRYELERAASSWAGRAADAVDSSGTSTAPSPSPAPSPEEPPELSPMPPEAPAVPSDTLPATTAGARLLEIEVRSADGAPLANALVELRLVDGTQMTQHTLTDTSGRATLRLHGDSRYTLVVLRGGHRSVTRRVQPGTSTDRMTITLPALDDEP